MGGSFPSHDVSHLALLSKGKRERDLEKGF